MADEAALALQAGGSPSAAAAMEAASQPAAEEPLRKRPRRDGPGLGRSPGEPSAAAAVAAAAGCEAESAAAPAALWREAVGAAAAGAEPEAPATAAAGDGDNGSGLRREPRAADDFDDDEGEEDDEAAAAAAAIGYRGEWRARGRDRAVASLRVPACDPVPGWPGPRGLLGLGGGSAARPWLGRAPPSSPALQRSRARTRRSPGPLCAARSHPALVVVEVFPSSDAFDPSAFIKVAFSWPLALGCPVARPSAIAFAS